MKMALCNDTHAGARGNSLIFNEYFFEFWDNIFFPYLKKNNIKHIMHLGDLVDIRKNINYVILNSWNKRFFQRCEDEGIQFEIIVGNHDVAYKNTNEINAIEELFRKKYPNIILHTKPIIKNFDGTDIALIPWINDENYNESMSLIKTTKAQICFGHFEIAGFEFDRGNVCHSGLDRAIFKKFDRVLSGHFHHKSSDGTIDFLGCQYQMTWSDYGDQKGFHVFDTDSRQLDYIKNPNEMFVKIVYDEYDIEEIKPERITNKHVKLMVRNRKDHDKFDKYVGELERLGPADFTIIDSDMGIDIQLEDNIDETKSTLDILIETTRKTPLPNVDPKDVEKLLRDLHMESQQMETD